MIKNNSVVNGDCLEVMKDIESNSIDCIITDLPYGTTSSKWDIVIPFAQLWEHYTRIIKNNGAIVLFSSQPFTSLLITSNPKMFKYCWVWDKKLTGNPMLAKYQPLKIHEEICVFSKGRHNYYPIMTKGKKRITGGGTSKLWDMSMAKTKITDEYYPKSIITYNIKNRKSFKHPTQKPTDLLEYLIKTYSKEDDVILDSCMGSGSTIVSAIKLNRKYIGIEKDKKYYDIAKNWIDNAIDNIQNE